MTTAAETDFWFPRLQLSDQPGECLRRRRHCRLSLEDGKGPRGPPGARPARYATRFEFRSGSTFPLVPLTPRHTSPLQQPATARRTRCAPRWRPTRFAMRPASTTTCPTFTRASLTFPGSFTASTRATSSTLATLGACAAAVAPRTGAFCLVSHQCFPFPHPGLVSQRGQDVWRPVDPRRPGRRHLSGDGQRRGAREASRHGAHAAQSGQRREPAEGRLWPQHAAVRLSARAWGFNN